MIRQLLPPRPDVVDERIEFDPRLVEEMTNRLDLQGIATRSRPLVGAHQAKSREIQRSARPRRQGICGFGLPPVRRAPDLAGRRVAVVSHALGWVIAGGAECPQLAPRGADVAEPAAPLPRRPPRAVDDGIGNSRHPGSAGHFDQGLHQKTPAAAAARSSLHGKADSAARSSSSRSGVVRRAVRSRSVRTTSGTAGVSPELSARRASSSISSGVPPGDDLADDIGRQYWDERFDQSSGVVRVEAMQRQAQDMRLSLQPYQAVHKGSRADLLVRWVIAGTDSLSATRRGRRSG